VKEFSAVGTKYGFMSSCRDGYTTAPSSGVSRLACRFRPPGLCIEPIEKVRGCASTGGWERPSLRP
jgi:hypothetical protein